MYMLLQTCFKKLSIDLWLIIVYNISKKILHIFVIGACKTIWYRQSCFKPIYVDKNWLLICGIAVQREFSLQFPRTKFDTLYNEQQNYYCQRYAIMKANRNGSQINLRNWFERKQLTSHQKCGSITWSNLPSRVRFGCAVIISRIRILDLPLHVRVQRGIRRRHLLNRLATRGGHFGHGLWPWLWREGLRGAR